MNYFGPGGYWFQISELCELDACSRVARAAAAAEGLRPLGEIEIAAAVRDDTESTGGKHRIADRLGGLDASFVLGMDIRRDEAWLRRANRSRSGPGSSGGASTIPAAHVTRGHRSRKELMMDTIDFDAVAELYLSPAKGGMRRPMGYRRFGRAADAVRCAVEELPAGSLKGAFLEVGEQRFGGEEIRRLYERPDYPLERHANAVKPVGGSDRRVLSFAEGRKRTARLAKP